MGDGTWTSLNSAGLQTHLLNGMSLHPTKPFVALVGSQDNSTALSSGLTWQYETGGDSGLVRYDPDPANDGKYAYSAGPPDPDPNFFARSDSEGSGPWVNKGFARPEFVPFNPLFTIHPTQTSRLLFGLSRVYETTNRGDSWSAISPQLPSKDSPADAICYGGDDTTIYVAYGRALYGTTDGGKNWATLGATAGFSFISGISSRPGFPATAYVVDRAGGVFRTTDAGASWANIATNLPRVECNTVAVHKLGPQFHPWIFVGTAVGLYAAVDRDTSTAWARYGVGLPDANVTDIDLVPSQNLIGVATYGRGAFTNTVDGNHLPSVSIDEQRTECSIGSIGGGRGRFSGNAQGFVTGPLTYEWSVEQATILSGAGTSHIVVGVPSSGTFVVNLVVRDSAGQEAASRLIVSPVSAQAAQVVEHLCKVIHDVKYNWFVEPLWDPIRERPVSATHIVREIARLRASLHRLEQIAERLPVLMAGPSDMKGE